MVTNFKFKILDSQRGFTIIEMLVSAFVFSIIVIATSSIFIQVLSSQRRGSEIQKIEENGQYILELMAREIRVSTIAGPDSPICSLTSLTITHPVNGVVTYALNNGVLQRTAGGIVTDLSSSDVQFLRFNFCVLGSAVVDDQTARVTIIMAIQNKTGNETLTMNMQTTIASRDLKSELP